MRPLLFSIFLLLCHPAWGANCAEVAATLNRDLNPKVDAAELAEVLASLNRKGQLPAKFISKREARAAGWTPGSNLWQALPGRSIGGDRFGNYEKNLPPGRYSEADLDYQGGKRGTKRIVFSDSRRFVTVDHYRTFREAPPCR